MRGWLSFLAFSGLNLALVGQTTPSSPSLPPDSPANPPVTSPAGAVATSASAGPARPLAGNVSSPRKENASEHPPSLQWVEYLLQHNDENMAIAYLQKIVASNDLSSDNRSHALILLADNLIVQHKYGDALYWLKIWSGLYPGRPEAGAVAYRTGLVYQRMNMPQLARDTYYAALSYTVNQGKVQSASDLKYYTSLTDIILWNIAENEYQSREWQRAADLFERYSRESHPEQAALQEKAAFLQAECYYQLKQVDKAQALYETALQQHPFNPQAPEARLHLFHLYFLKNEPELAQQELESLAWTVRTVWPQTEEYWKQQTTQLILALNEKDAPTLAALLKTTSYLSEKNNTWKEIFAHYNKISTYQGSPLPKDDTTSEWRSEVQQSSSENEQLQNLSFLLDRDLPVLPPLPPTTPL